MARIRPITQVKSGPATVSGSGIAPNVGAGAMQAAASAILGSGARIVSSDGVLVAQSAAVVGASEPYDLAGARTIPFAYSWPTEPTITAETSVSNSSELATAIALGGRRITLNAGTYSGITINTNDTHLIISTGVSVSAAGGAALTIGGNRVRITGDRGATMSGRWQITGDDVFIEDQNMANSDGENVIIQGGAARVAILSSTMSSERFALQTYGGVSDIIVANSSITVSSQTPARLAKVDRLLLVDNLFDASGAGSAHVFRSGENYVNNLWFLGNQLEDTGTFGFEFSVVDPDSTAARVTSSGLYFYDSALYSSGNTAMVLYAPNTGDEDYVENLQFDNFTIYSGGKSPGSNIFPISGFGTAGQVNWSETNSGYQASTTAPAWTMN